MGRRELLIVIGFLIVGAIAYQVTAPPAADGPRFSLRRLVDEIRADIRSDSASARVTLEGTIALSSDVAELRLSGVTTRIEVTGEDRPDIAYVLAVRSTGPDEATAADYARRSTIVEDDLGDVLGLRVSYPPEARQASELTLRIPRRLNLQVDGGNSLTISHLQAVRLNGVIGETTAEDISDGVTGTHRNGRLRVARAGAVSMNLTSSRAEFEAIDGDLTLTVSRGESRVSDSRGPITVEQSNHEMLIRRHEGTVRITGTGGRIEIEEPRGEVRVDVRRAEVDLVVDRAVPMMVITTEDTLRVALDGPPPIVLDAIISGRGTIVADEFGLQPESDGDQTKIVHAFGPPDATRMSLRNRRADIVIRSRK